MWERRTAIVSTAYFLRQGDVADTFTVAEILLTDDQDLIHKATGGWLREAGKHDRQQLLRFLDTYAATMPRVALRYAIEHQDTAGSLYGQEAGQVAGCSGTQAAKTERGRTRSMRLALPPLKGHALNGARLGT